MSAKPAISRKPRTQRAPAPMPDEDDFEMDDEAVEETKSRAHKAKVKRGPHVTTRVAVDNTPRGGRQARSAYDRGNGGRSANKRTNEFSEDEIRDFMSEEENLLPKVPDTKDWHYKWTRVQIGGKDDGGNIVANINGKMGYEIVTGPDMLPPGLNLDSLSLREGDHQGAYQFRDAMLMRCPMRNYKLSMIASHRRARQLDEMLDHGSQAGFIPGEERTGIIVEQNVEKTGIREVDPGDGGEEY